jgi:hypothetical protein
MEHQPDPELCPDPAPEDGGPNTSGNPITPNTSDDEELVRTLQSCLSVFQSASVKDIITEDLAFCKPSKNDNPNTPPPLQTCAIENASFLGYQNCIMTLYSDTDNLECGGLEKCELIKNQLLTGLLAEWNKLEDIKLRAWQRRNGAQKARVVAPLPQAPPGSAQVMDTCSSFLCILLTPESSNVVF